VLTLPITKQSKQQEWKTIAAIARNNGFPTYTVHNLKKKLKAKNSSKNKNHQPLQLNIVRNG
jgi:hypothetical protein